MQVLIFRCEICEVSFARESHLKRHISSVHEGNKEQKCEECKKKNFAEKSKLKVHVISVHEGKKHTNVMCAKLALLKNIV